jgi:hypothetical protein
MTVVPERAGEDRPGDGDGPFPGGGSVWVFGLLEG